jgi:hypothetical protein
MDPIFLTMLVLLAIVVFFVLVAIFQWLWNITMPQVFNLTTISYWQAFRILLISGFLFGSSHFPSFNFNM